VSNSYFKSWPDRATKIPSEHETIFRLCCLSLAMQTLIPPLRGLQMRYSQGAKMYSVPSYRGSNSEASASFQCAETGGPHPYPQGRRPWSMSPSWETGVSSGSLQIKEQEEEEKACLCSCSWKCSI
ncbi:mCG145661, partial [Mus musculus]